MLYDFGTWIDLPSTDRDTAHPAPIDRLGFATQHQSNIGYVHHFTRFVHRLQGSERDCVFDL